MGDIQMDDIEIVQKILNGEKQFYELIVRRFNPVLYRIWRAYNLCHEDTQDVMQESFVDAYRGLGGFRNESSFKTWISRIMINRCFHHFQKNRVTDGLMISINDNNEVMRKDSENEADKGVMQRELANMLEDSMSRIPLEYRMVFILREVNGMNTDETAELLDITPGNVKVRLNRSKALLRKEIEKSFDEQALFEFHLRYCDEIVNNVMRLINLKSLL